MGTPLSAHSGVTTLIEIPGHGVMLAAGPTVPTDAEVGYGKAGLFLHTDGADDTAMVYLNIGDNSSCNFDAIDWTP
jgi:hypothetical protein